MENCERCQSDDERDSTYTCTTCHIRKKCEICGELLKHGKGFVSPCCYPIENRCIKRCENCRPHAANWKCKDCLMYILGDINERGAQNQLVDYDLNEMLKDTFAKICFLKRCIREEKVFEVDGKRYNVYEVVGEGIKGAKNK